ncbi:MAG: hypothetical protein AAGE18_14875 [Pseudomonadota bacterium]
MPGSQTACRTDPAALDAALHRLHGTPAARELSLLHEEAAGLFDDTGSRRFHLTHAWIYALVAGEGARIGALEAELRALGGL